MATQKLAVGIDLGSTYSRVGVFHNGKVEIIPDDEGNVSTPSYVAFTATERLIGDEAKFQIAQNPQNTIFDVKKLIGRKFDDPKIQKNLKNLPFKVVNDCSKPKISAEFEGTEKLWSPEEISAMVLIKVKKIAENHLGHAVSDAVITVPGYFNNSQRQATMDAGKIAGLDVLSIINESSAAAIAYFRDEDITDEGNVLIYSLGGGTFDVSIVNISGGDFIDVSSTAGDAHLGGEDFDNKLVAHFVEEFKKSHSEDLQTCPRALIRLRTTCEEAKRTLSSNEEASIEIDALFKNINFCTKISRAKFEELCLDIFKSTLKFVEQALESAMLKKNEIHKVVLVGGSTRIPKIRNLLKNFFNGKELCTSINSDETVVYGAACQAAILSETVKQDMKVYMKVLDVTPFSLHVQAAGGKIVEIINDNVNIPFKVSGEITTRNHPVVDIKVYEGEANKAKNKHLLGTFTLVPRGVPKTKMTFDLDTNGILQVFIHDEVTGTARTIRLMNVKLLPQGEIKKMEDEMKLYEKVLDKEQRHKVATRVDLDSYVCYLKHIANFSPDDILTDADKEKIRDICDCIIQWLGRNPLPEKDKICQKMKEIKLQLSPLMVKIDKVSKFLNSSENVESKLIIDEG